MPNTYPAEGIYLKELKVFFSFILQTKTMRTLFLVLLFSIQLKAQQTLQNIKGSVTDRDSKEPLKGATVWVTETEINALTDSLGNFVLKNIPTGRIRIEVSYIGYQSYLSDYIILNAAKEYGLDVEMEEEKKHLEGVVIKTSRNPKQPVNRYALLSGRSFSPEETQRYAASANDPSRMALGFPGVQATRDARSDIVIRGNNPVAMQWRLEGLDVINPNHFARKGSTGGGITILSLSMLDNSDFLTGGMPAEYGDVLSGAFDMHLRKGNNQKPEHSFKAGMIGLDYSIEGPIKKGSSSFLMNYRYSTLGLLSAMGLNLVDERENNNFQDLAFNLAFSNKNKSVQWNFWGMGGYSKETGDEVKDTLKWKQYDDYAVYDFKTKMGAIGLGSTLRISEKSFLKSSLALIAQEITYVDDTLTRKKIASTVNNEFYRNNRIAFTSSYNHKFSPSANLKTGCYITSIMYHFKRNALDYTTNFYRNFVDGQGSSILLQPYLQMSIKPGKRLTINPGMHILYLALNKKTSIDPRLSMQYKIGNKKNISIAYGLFSKILPLGSYFYYSSGSYPNRNLDMMRAYHLIFAYDQMLGNSWRLHTEAYFERLSHIPVVNNINRTFWILNQLDGYAQEALVSKGKGTNKGLDLSAEKFFSKGLFTIFSFSIFNSTYEPLNGKTYNTQFNSQTSGSWTGAKEWKIKGNKVIQLGWKMVYNGGLPLTPLLAIQSTTREPLLDETRPYSERVSFYYRTDTRFSLRKDKTGRSWQLALDIQNVLGIKNTDGLGRKYDPSVNQWVYKTQSGIVPVLSYQVDF